MIVKNYKQRGTMIIIDNNYALTADRYNFILLKKNRNEKFKRIAFFQNINFFLKKNKEKLKELESVYKYKK